MGMNDEPESMHGWRFDALLSDIFDTENWTYDDAENSRFSTEYLIERCIKAEKDRDQARKEAESVSADFQQFVIFEKDGSKHPLYYPLLSWEKK